MQKRVFFHIIRYVLCFFIVCALLLPAAAHAEGEKTIRVGLYSKEGYHTVDETGAHSGYDYEYLERISSYTGWEYEYVEGTLEECLEMLERGEIDLLTGIQKTEDRMDVMAFSDAPTMYASVCLVQRENDDYNYEDFESFDGLRIGTQRASSINDVLREYSEDKGFSYIQQNYNTIGEARQALDAGEIDTACLASNQDLSGYKVMAQFGYMQFYYAVSMNRLDLLPELNEAIGRINTNDQAFLSELYAKYFSSFERLAFTEEEQAYIDRGEPVKVALYMDMGTLFCHYNETERRYEGIAIDALELLSERTGLKFTYTEIPEGQSPKDYLETHPDEVVAPSFLNSLIGLSDSYIFFDPIVEGKMVGVVWQNAELRTDDSFVLAVPVALYDEADYLEDMFPNVEVVPCKDHASGMRMVQTGRADMALVNTVTAVYKLQSPYYENLKTIDTLGITEDMTLSMNAASDPELVSILSKGIATIGERDARQVMLNNTASVSYQLSPAEWLYQNRYVLALTLFVMLWFIGTIVWKIKERSKKIENQKQKQLAQAHHEAELEYQGILLHKTRFDSLSGLYNQEYFYEKADQLMAENPGKVFVFYRVNLKSFAMINEIYGMDVGDMVLRGFADVLRTEVGKKGIYGRLYSDQFAICIPKSLAEIQRMATDNVRFLNCGKQKIRVQMNVGVYECKDGNHSAARCSDYANLALRNGDSAGVEHLFYYQNSVLETMLQNQHITSIMEESLKNGQFQVYYQPQVDILLDGLVGAEALVRWIHPELGTISPNIFIPVFEGNRFIYQLDSYVCEQVCAQLAEWKKNGKLVPVSINLSRIDLEEPDLIPMLMRTVKKYDVPTRYLHLEITESIYVEDQKRPARVIQRLREHGFCIEMDDFGSGYSSLNMLKDIPVDVLKLDMEFFKDGIHMDRGGTIIESVVKMAHSMGIVVVAEGVETQRESNFLQSIHCYIVQGYLYGKPEPAAMFEKRLAESTIGRKMIEVQNDDGVNNLYWKMEALNLLMIDSEAMILDYDPIRDYADVVAMDSAGGRREFGMVQYLESLADNCRICPDSYGLIREALAGTEPLENEFDFRGDFDGTGEYQWLHAVVRHYRKNGSRTRTLVIIRKDHLMRN